MNSNDENKSRSTCGALEHRKTFTLFLSCLLFIGLFKMFYQHSNSNVKGQIPCWYCVLNGPVCSIWSCILQLYVLLQQICSLQLTYVLVKWSAFSWMGNGKGWNYEHYLLFLGLLPKTDLGVLQKGYKLQMWRQPDCWITCKLPNLPLPTASSIYPIHKPHWDVWEYVCDCGCHRPWKTLLAFMNGNWRD